MITFYISLKIRMMVKPNHASALREWEPWRGNSTSRFPGFCPTVLAPARGAAVGRGGGEGDQVTLSTLGETAVTALGSPTQGPRVAFKRDS